ncbi:MAG: amylosucrase, partial [Sporichthyaceae bacterium]
MAVPNSGPESRDRARAVLDALLPAVRSRAVAGLGPVEGEGLAARLEQHHLDLVEPLDGLYGAELEVDGLTALVGGLLDRTVGAALTRPAPLRASDRRREVDPGWFQRSRMVGYVAYVDRFAGDLRGVRDRLDYLAELGVTYVHLMPLLAPREGDSDGGYAVVDYDAVDPRLGTMADLEDLAADLHARGMSLCIDLVLNHTAAEHPWARAAAAGDPAYRGYYLIYPDRALPDRYERTLPEVFPDQAPGSFTHVEGVGWVWTTFNSFQWDLDWTNPAVFGEMLATMLRLADHGVDVLRLDAAPFLWKREGTDCQNQPEVHLVLQALRALVTVGTPGVAFKAEAIVAPQHLVQYLGGHERFRPECDLAYHNQLMVLLWSTLATRDTRLARTALGRMQPAPSSTSWVTYLRCHDDIGWAVSDEDAWACGLDPRAHRSFLSDFYAGLHPGSFARGAAFQANPRTGDRRISGSAASLVGLDAALDSGDAVEAAIAGDRLLMLYSVVYVFGGVPLLYMGDELAQRNDPHWADDPVHAGDNRWLHRPPWDRAGAARRHDPTTVEGRVFAGLAELARARAGLVHLRAGGSTEVLDVGDDRVLAVLRRHPRSGRLVALAAFNDQPVRLPRRSALACFPGPAHLVLAGPGVELHDDGLVLPPWSYAWV